MKSDRGAPIAAAVGEVHVDDAMRGWLLWYEPRNEVASDQPVLWRACPKCRTRLRFDLDTVMAAHRGAERAGSTVIYLTEVFDEAEQA